MRGTGLLNLCWMECLGLHNKPKAEVHLGHKLTGPKEEEESPTQILALHLCISTHLVTMSEVVVLYSLVCPIVSCILSRTWRARLSNWSHLKK
jgi:hypothetical protein